MVKMTLILVDMTDNDEGWCAEDFQRLVARVRSGGAMAERSDFGHCNSVSEGIYNAATILIPMDPP